MRCEHEHDDGAYVLGALSPAERAAYERHLATCSFCREAVRDISTLPDLLSRLDADEFAKLVDPSLSRGTHAPARRRNKGQALRVRVLSTATAAVLAALVGVGVVLWTRDGTPAVPPPGPAVAMTPVADASPLSATVRLTNTTGGTKVDMMCSYSKDAPRAYTFRLVAIGPREEKEQVGSWQATPGTDFPMPGMTHFARDSLARLELVRSDGKVMLAYDVP
jgi:hypothetical protein